MSRIHKSAFFIPRIDCPGRINFADWDDFGYSNLLFQHSLPAGNRIPKPWEQKSRPVGNSIPDRLGTATPTGREKLQNRQNKEKGDGLRAGEQPPSAMPLQQQRGEGKAFHGHGGGSCSATVAPPQSAYPAGPASCRSVQG